MGIFSDGCLVCRRPLLPVDHTAECFTHVGQTRGGGEPLSFQLRPSESIGKGGRSSTVAFGLQAPFWMHQERSEPTFFGTLYL